MRKVYEAKGGNAIAGTNGNPKPDREDPALAEALAAANRGWRVFPMHGVNAGGRCTCEKAHCADPGKHPRITNNLVEATTDPQKIRHWSKKWPRCNWGMNVGGSGLVVQDIDPRNGGDATLEDLEHNHGPAPETVQVITGGGGRHRYWKHPGPSYRVKSDDNVLGPGIDIKADGGLVVLPGAVHKSGLRYRWVPDVHPDLVEVADMPAWMLGMVAVLQREQRNGSHLPPLYPLRNSVLSVTPVPSPSQSSLAVTPSPLPDIGDALIDEAIKASLPSSRGQRNGKIFQFARRLKAIPGLAGRNAIDLEPLIGMWFDAALPYIGTASIDVTLDDFFHAWESVEYPYGTGPFDAAVERARGAADPPELHRFEDQTRLLGRLCRELQAHAGTEPFYITCETAGEAIGVEKMDAWRRLRLLGRYGIIEVKERGKRGRASRYRYLLPIPLPAVATDQPKPTPRRRGRGPA